jgi:hypothetical protein
MKAVLIDTSSTMIFNPDTLAYHVLLGVGISRFFRGSSRILSLIESGVFFLNKPFIIRLEEF